MTNLNSFIDSPRNYLSQNREIWLRPLIIIAALLISVALAFRGSPTQLISMVTLGIGAVGALAFLRWPGLGLIILPFAGMILPNVGPAGLNGSMLIIGLMLVLWIGEMVVRKRKIKLVSSRTITPALALIVISCLAFVMGQLPWMRFTRNAPLDAQLGGLSIFLLSIGAFLLVAHQVRNLRWLQLMTWIMIAFGGIYVIGRSIPSVFGPILSGVYQPQAIGGVFYAWLPAMALSQALFNRKLSPIIRVVFFAIVLATLYYTYFVTFGWKSGWIPALTAIGIVILLRAWQLGFLLVPVAALVFVKILPDIYSSDTYSISTRVDAWGIILEIVKVNPILGLGFANYYWYTPLFQIRGWMVSFNSHNNYVDIVAQTGLLGLAGFLWLFLEIGRVGWRLLNRVPEGFPKAYVCGSLAGLVGTLVAAALGDWVLPFTYNVGMAGFRTGVLAWLFLGGLVALETMYVNGDAA